MSGVLPTAGNYKIINSARPLLAFDDQSVNNGALEISINSTKTMLRCILCSNFTAFILLRFIDVTVFSDCRARFYVNIALVTGSLQCHLKSLQRVSHELFLPGIFKSLITITPEMFELIIIIFIS